MKVKGRSEIILTDVNTGEIETYKDTNMVTNALAKFLEPVYGVNMFATTLENDEQLWTSLLGGIMLFDDTITENTNNVFDVGTASMVANAGYGFSNSESVDELGTFNANESGIQSDGSLKLTFDWTTSQGNGTIKSACLSSAIGAIVGRGNKSLTHLSDDNAKFLGELYKSDTTKSAQIINGNNYSKILYADYTNNLIYVLKSITSSKIVISKCGIDLSGYTLTNKYGLENNLIEDIEITVPDEVKTYLGSSIVYYDISNNDNVAYFVIANSYKISSGATFYVLKLDSAMNVTTYKMTNTTGDALNMSCSTSNYTWNKRQTSCVTDNGYLIIQNYSQNVLYSVKLSDSTVISKLDEQASEYDYRLYCIGNTVYDMRNIYYMRVFNLETGLKYTTNGNMTENTGYFPTNCIPVAGNPLLYIAYSYNSSYDTDEYVQFSKRCDYLATINNLASPVTKTAAKSMKLIYTLTFE